MPKKSKEISTPIDANPADREAASTPNTATLGGYFFLFLLIASFGCAADLLSKQWVFQWQGAPVENETWWLWDGYVGIETAINTGALFGLGHDRVTFFAVISIVAIFAVVFWYFASGATRDRLLSVALGCVFGGILGNLYDRLGLWGQAGVRDWILLKYGQYTWPNFNIADSLLVCGAALLLWHGFRGSATAGQVAGNRDN